MLILLIIFIAWIVFNNIGHEKNRKHELEREKYWASPEGIKERQRQIEDGEKARKWLDYIGAVRSFKKRHQWCWYCKAPIKINIDTEEPIYFNNKQEEEQFNKELFRIVCSRCFWVVCDNCKSCGCGKNH